METKQTEFSNYDELAKLEYGRILWKKAIYRERLVRHWTDERHPHADRFARYRKIVERVLEAPPENDPQLDLELREQGWSLRTAMREIPSVFGQFWADSGKAGN